MLRVLSPCDSYPIVCSGTYHDSRHQGANEGLLYSTKGIWSSHLLPLHKKMKIKFPSKCLLTYILIPVPVAIDPVCNGCVVVAKETMELPDVDLSQKHNCNFVYHSALCLFNSWKGWNEGVFFSQKREIAMVISRRASTEGTQSTVFFSLIFSAAFSFLMIHM